jgi:hypothetical protein
MSHNRHNTTLAQIFAHPTSHNIHWRDIVHLFEVLGGTVEETKHDHLKVRLSDKEMSFKIPHSGNHVLQDDHEISSIRRFLRECGHAPAE